MMTPRDRIPLPRLLAVFALVGLTSLGGRLAYYHDALVEKRRWLTNQEFLDGSALSNFIPGPIFVNFTVYAARILGGWRAVVPGILLCSLPGAAAMLLLTIGYDAGIGRSAIVAAGLTGLTAAGAAFSAVTWLRLILANPLGRSGAILATIAFVALGPLHLSLLWVVPPLALIGLWIHRPRRGLAS